MIQIFIERHLISQEPYSIVPTGCIRDFAEVLETNQKAVGNQTGLRIIRQTEFCG